MTICTAKEAIRRIDSTRMDSPVMVTRVHKYGYVDVFYYNVTHARRLARAKHPSVVGVYHRGMPEEQIIKEIEQASKELPIPK